MASEKEWLEREIEAMEKDLNHYENLLDKLCAAISHDRFRPRDPPEAFAGLLETAKQRMAEVERLRAEVEHWRGAAKEHAEAQTAAKSEIERITHNMVQTERQRSEIEDLEGRVERQRGVEVISDNWSSPCVLCGYNGPGFHSPETHPCAEWETERDALLGEIDRLNRVVDAVKKDLDLALSDKAHIGPGERLSGGSLIYTEKWCDGTEPCAANESDMNPHGHWRGGRRIALEALLRDVAEKQREACVKVVERDVSNDYIRQHLTAAFRAAPLVTHPSKHATKCQRLEELGGEREP